MLRKVAATIIAITLITLAGMTTATAAHAATETHRVVYQAQTDGSWRVIEGDWRAIPTDGSATVTIVKPTNAPTWTSNGFADSIVTQTGANKTHAQATRWRGMPRLIISWETKPNQKVQS